MKLFRRPHETPLAGTSTIPLQEPCIHGSFEGPALGNSYVASHALSQNCREREREREMVVLLSQRQVGAFYCCWGGGAVTGT